MRRLPCLMLVIAVSALAACGSRAKSESDSISNPLNPPASAVARPAKVAEAQSGEIEARDLPREGQEVLQLIKRGGPFNYSKDGTIFGNREGNLPRKPRGYYREYTVKTPGVRDRGARRIIAGEGGECYYTDDHYSSFKRIRER